MMPLVPKDPYEHIRYNKAFDQEAIYKKHRPLIEKLNCARNVFFKEVEAQANQASLPSSREYVRISIDENPDNELNQLAQEIDLYAKDCLKCLNHARRMALAEPGIHALTEMGLIGGGAALAITALGSGSMGGSFAGFAAIFDSLRLLRGTIQSGHNLLSWPNNPLESLEENFAKNKLYIPKVLWPSIIRAFVSARQNEFEREKYTNFINFATGITTYKPKPIINSKNNLSPEDIKEELNQRIDNFFINYENTEVKFQNHIKTNISKFIDLLVKDDLSPVVMPMPRYLYLHGSGGIGKTHFVQTLSEWIEELIPGSVGFEDLVITSADELEGNAERPGAFLRVLRNQLLQNKRGSVIVIDEATWLNDDSMISSAKRIFNGDRSKLSTSYFGAGIDGTGISLEIPPMLIFVASNDSIKDPALESRFDTINYPKPNRNALIQHAINIISQSNILKRKNILPNQEAIATWIDKLNEKNLNFRYIAGNIEVYFLELNHQD